MTTKHESANNAILLNRELVELLRTSVASNAGPFDFIPERRALVDEVCREMMDRYYPNNGAQSFQPVYYTGSKGETYKWFDSEWAKYIQGLGAIKDKGRFVEALIVLYLYLPDSDMVNNYITCGRRLRLPRLSDEKASRIAQRLPEIGALKEVDSQFEPATLQ